jgi:hypothetical protein
LTTGAEVGLRGVRIGEKRASKNHLRKNLWRILIRRCRRKEGEEGLKEPKT